MSLDGGLELRKIDVPAAVEVDRSDHRTNLLPRQNDVQAGNHTLELPVGEVTVTLSYSSVHRAMQSGGARVQAQVEWTKGDSEGVMYDAYIVGYVAPQPTATAASLMKYRVTSLLRANDGKRTYKQTDREQ